MPRSSSGKWYVVRKGTLPGVYDSWTKTAPKVKASNAVYQSFYTKADADTVWQQVLGNGWAVVLEPGSSGRATQPSFHSPSRGSSSSRRPLGPSQSLSAIDDRSDRPIVGVSGKWYVVSSGLRTGVFPNWIQASVYVENVKGSVHEAFSSKADADRAYSEAQAAGEVSVIGTGGPRSYHNAPNQFHTHPQAPLSTPPLTPKVEEFEHDLHHLEDESEWAHRIGALSISSAAPAYHSSWNPSNGRTPLKPAARRHLDEDHRFLAPGPLTQHRSLPTASFASPENSVLLQRAHSEGYANGTPSGLPTHRPRATVGSAPHLRGYTARKQLMPKHDALSPLSTPGINSFSIIDQPSPKRGLTDSSSRSDSSRVSTPLSSVTPPMVTATQSPILDAARQPDRPMNPGSPNSFDLRDGTSMYNGAHRTPRSLKKNVLPPFTSQMGLSDMHVPLTYGKPGRDIRSPMAQGTYVPAHTISLASLVRPSPSYSSTAAIPTSRTERTLPAEWDCC